LPATDQAAAECLSSPVHPSLSAEDLAHIITVAAVTAAGG
jgi:hypothetical protein